MQPTGPTTTTPSKQDLLKTMQPPTQQIFVPSSGSNGTGNIRPNQQTTTIYRGPPTSTPPRSGARHVPMPAMFQQPMHQGVVVNTYQQFGPRQPTYQGPPYSYSQTLPYYSSYQYYQPMQQPQTHQRGPVGVNQGVGVNVGNAISVQPGPNGPSGATQTQMALTPGAVLTGPVPPGTSAVLNVSSPGPGQQQVGVGMASMVGVTVPGTAPTQSIQPKARRRKHALQIIDPDTNRNILEDIDISKGVSNTEIDNQEQITTMPAVSPEVQMAAVLQQQDLSMSVPGSVPIVMSSDNRTAIIYNMEMHQQMPQQRDISGGQTPIVSAMSDAPSVEIRPTLQKLRNKKIIPIAPKDEPIKTSSLHKTSEESGKQHQPLTQTYDETSVKLVHVQQLPQTSQVPQESRQEPNQHSNIQATQLDIKNSTIASAAITTLAASTIEISKDSSSYPNTTSRTSALNPITTYCYNPTDSQNHLIDANSKSCDLATNIVESKNSSGPEIPIATACIAAEKIESVPNNMKLNDKETITPPANVYIETDTTATYGSSIQQNSVQTKSTKESQVPFSQTEQNTNNNFGSQIVKTASNRLNNNDDNENADIDSNETQVTASAALEQVPRDETDRCDTVLQMPPLNFSDKDLVNNNVEDKIDPLLIVNVTSTSNGATPETDTSTASALNEATTGNVTPALDAAPVAPLITYSEGQWSPLNPTGKKQYAREQLLQLREAKASRIQPEVNNVSILPQPNLMPSFARGNNSNKRVQSMVGSIGGSRGGDSGSYMSKQASMTGVNKHSNSSTKSMFHINLSLNQDVKLSETENAWRPRVFVGGKGENDPDVQSQREKDELIRSVRGILNKLTPEKFDALVEEIIKLKIDTPDKMEDVMVLVFEKAIDEPNFSVSYARLCHRLINEVRAQDERMESGTKTNLLHFRNALIDKTEREFTQNVTNRVGKIKKLQPIMDKIKNCSDTAEKVELQALLEEEERKIRRRSGGTVRFIGELFKISMLTGKIINHCIETLLEPKSEDMLECLCKLLTTVGAKFEQTPMNTKDPNTCNYSLNKNIEHMQSIASKSDKDGSRVSSRVRFMLQDVIDLRKNKWQSSRNEAPKTMDQIEKETKNEQMSSQYLNYGGMLAASGSGSGGGNQNSGKRDDRGNGGRYDSRSGGGYGGSHSQRGDTGSLRRQQQSGSGGGNSGGGMGLRNSSISGNNDDNTWHIQTGKGRSSLAVDSHKLEGLSLTQNLDMGSKKMGGLQQFLWSSAQRQSPSTTTPTNSFAMLSSLVDTNKSTSDRDNRDRGGPRNKGSYNKGSMERDRYNDRGIHSRTGSSQGSRENSSSRGNQGGRGMMNASSMQKSASHKNYSQPMAPRMSGKTSGITSMSSTAALQLHNRSVEQSNQSSQQLLADSSNTQLPFAPAAVFENPSDAEMKLMKSVVSEMIEIAANSKTITTAIAPCINRIKEKQRCGLLYYILTDYLHLANVGQVYRRSIANIVIYLIKQKFISVDHFRLAYDEFCNVASDLIFDVPELWLYIFEFSGLLISKQILTINDLWIKRLQEDEELGEKFLRTYLVYCTREIGLSFTRSMWQKFNMQWTDFMPENNVQSFIKTNKFEYIENEARSPEIIIKDSKENHVTRIVERVEHLLSEGSDQNDIIDYINGNIVDVDKVFIRSLTTAVSNFAINFKDSSYKLDTENFQKVCIPVLQRYIDSNEERELECLHAMQLLVHGLEHPRGLLSELFAELYDNDVIPQESFIKWRDSKDQSAGKGVAVKGLNPFFTHILSGETSDENN